MFPSTLTLIVSNNKKGCQNMINMFGCKELLESFSQEASLIWESCF